MSDYFGTVSVILTQNCLPTLKKKKKKKKKAHVLNTLCVMNNFTNIFGESLTYYKIL